MRMQTSAHLFLLASEEKSLTEAAQRAHITQQCLSSHILKLEKTLGAKLFIRKPSLQLTPAGELVAHSLRQIEIIEKDLKDTLGEIQLGTWGNINIGMSPSRAQLLLSGTICNFQPDFPNVKISCYTEDTAICEEMLEKGELSLFLGVNPSINSKFEYIPVIREPLFLISTETLLLKHFKKNPNVWEEQIKHGIDLRDISTVPFVQNMENSALTQIIIKHTNSLRMEMNNPYNVSTHIPQIHICGTGLAAALCPEMLLQNVSHYNQIHSNEEPIKAYLIKNLTESLRLDIVVNKFTRKPRYLVVFMEMLKKEAVNLLQKVSTVWQLDEEQQLA